MVVRKLLNDLSDDIFEQEVKFDGDELEVGEGDDIFFNDINVFFIFG